MVLFSLVNKQIECAMCIASFAHKILSLYSRGPVDVGLLSD